MDNTSNVNLAYSLIGTLQVEVEVEVEVVLVVLVLFVVVLVMMMMLQFFSVFPLPFPNSVACFFPPVNFPSSLFPNHTHTHSQ